MKLEIRHLAPYLPYGLNLIYRQIGDDRTIKMAAKNISNTIKR